jgi:hypothetical protein
MGTIPFAHLSPEDLAELRRMAEAEEELKQARVRRRELRRQERSNPFLQAAGQATSIMSQIAARMATSRKTTTPSQS